MANSLRLRKSFTEIEESGSMDVEELQNRNTELEALVTSLKKLLETSRRRERKLVRALEETNSDVLEKLDLDECSEDGATHNIEPSFLQSTWDRTSWLTGLLVFQSLSSFILRYYDQLLLRFPTIVYFLTMLVGAGGNAGNQAAVKVIRGLALGTINPKTSGWYIARESLQALTIGSLIGIIGFARVCILSAVHPWESFVISIALFLIVSTSIVIGTVLPLAFEMMGIDPAHSSTTIQVIMDISGVLVTCIVATILLNQE